MVELLLTHRRPPAFTMPNAPELLDRAYAAHRQGRPQHAAQLYQQLLQQDGGNAQLWHLLGVACQEQGKLKDAIVNFQHAVQLNPRAAESLYALGNALASQGQREDAVEFYEQTVACQADHAEALVALGVALAEQGLRTEAIVRFQQAVRCRPEFAQAHHNLGIALAQEGRIEAAVAALEQALRCKPDYAEACYNLGNILKTIGRVAASEARYRQALDLQPTYADAYINLGLSLTEDGRAAEAVVLLQQAVRLRPETALAHNNLGLALADLGRSTAAEQSYQQALRLDPLYIEAHSNLGNLCKAQGRLAEAVASYDMAIRIKPDAASPHWNRALVWLLMGDFARGWPEYEWRWQRPQTVSRQFPQARWDGSPLTGRRLLVFMEQGLGDMIQFIRLVALVQRQGAEVIVECPPILQDLFKTVEGIDVLVVEGSPLPEFDVHVPLLSLPGLLGITAETIPAAAPYLRADLERVAARRLALAGLDGKKVGIAWQGNPKHGGDRQRSVPLRQIAALSRVPGVQLVSLQKGTGVEQLHASSLGFPVRDLDSASWPDFMETAAIIANLDLVITVDTAVAHLAGALGVPVWVALPYAPDWRWLLERSDTPWYPSMRLFRQPTEGDWRPVFAEMAEVLREPVQPNAAWGSPQVIESVGALRDE